MTSTARPTTSRSGNAVCSRVGVTPHRAVVDVDVELGLVRVVEITTAQDVGGVGEPPTISSAPAIVAAVRSATGKPLTRVPIRPEHIVGP